MRSDLAFMSNLGLILAVAFVAGCSVSKSPVAPSVTTADAPASPSVPALQSPVASLALEDAFAIGGHNWVCDANGCGPGPGYLYEVRFRVREMSGRSGAVIKSIAVSNPNLRQGETTSTQFQSESCWRSEARVPPGGTLDTFYSDDGADWLGYCWVGIDALPGVTHLAIEVFFRDDYGVEGSVRATVSTFRLR